MSTVAKYAETHDRLSLTIKFDDKTEMKISLGRSRMSITASMNIWPDVDAWKRATNFIMNYLDFKVGTTDNQTGDRFRAVKCYAESVDKKTFIEQAQSIAIIGERKAGNSKTPAKDVHPIVADLKKAMKNAKPATPSKVAPASSDKASKYEYPAGLNEAQKKAFRAKTRAAKKG